MQLVRYGPPHGEKPGILDSDGQVRDVSGEVPDIAGETSDAKKTRPTFEIEHAAEKLITSASSTPRR